MLFSRCVLDRLMRNHQHFDGVAEKNNGFSVTFLRDNVVKVGQLRRSTRNLEIHQKKKTTSHSHNPQPLCVAIVFKQVSKTQKTKM